MLRDPTHLFRRMWSAEAWARMRPGAAACWERKRDDPRAHITAEAFFEETRGGTHCDANWYEGNSGPLGEPSHRAPLYEAPALLGFDESIDEACTNLDGQHAESCVHANMNILSLYGDRIPYNLCRNLEWQTCAAQGLLPGQGNAAIAFARAPKMLHPDGSTGKPLGQCRGWVPSRPPEDGIYGYATDDVFLDG
jgi:hypothetical protein